MRMLSFISLSVVTRLAKMQLLSELAQIDLI